MKNNIKFSIGYNLDFKLLDLIAKNKNHISSMYFPVPNSISGSGRIEKHHDDYIKSIGKIISFCNDSNIKSILLLNATCDGIGIADNYYIKDVVDYVHNMHKEGLKAVSIVNHLYTPLLKDRCPNLEIIASINCYVKTVEHAMHLKNSGVDVITIDRDINYDLETIKNIKSSTGLKIQLLLNEGCLDNCPFRQMHFNLNSHKVSIEEAQYFIQNACLKSFETNPDLILSSPVIRPEDIHNYFEIADYFKISSRNYKLEEIKTVLDAYIDREYRGNFLDLVSSRNLKNMMYLDNTKLEGLFEKKIKCLYKKRVYGCSNCTTCSNYFHDAVVKSSSRKTYNNLGNLLKISDISKTTD